MAEKQDPLPSGRWWAVWCETVEHWASVPMSKDDARKMARRLRKTYKSTYRVIPLDVAESEVAK